MSDGAAGAMGAQTRGLGGRSARPRLPAADARRALAWGVDSPAAPRFLPCLDCGAERVGPFCHACGQGEVDPNATVRQLAGGAARDALSWDHRAWRTVRVLLTRPGALSQAWADGRRTRFVPPLRLFLTLGLVLVALGTVDGWAVDALGIEESPSETADRTEGTTVNAGYWIGIGMRWLGLNTVLLLAPLVGFAYFVLFNGRRPRLAPHLVHAVHIGCVAVLGMIVWRLASLAWLAVGPDQTLADVVDPSRPGLGLLKALVLLWLAGVTAYAAVSVRRFYGVPRWAAVLSAPLAVAVPLAVVLGVSVLVYVALLVR